MDSIGLMAAWTSVVSFFLAVLVAIVSYVFASVYRHWWARTSRTRSERRLKQLLAYREVNPPNLGTGYIAELVCLYGSAILNLVAAVGLVVLSIEILDLGPVIIAAAALPFNIDAKLLTRVVGALMLLIGYFFIFRLSYLAIQISRKRYVVYLNDV